MYFALSKIIVDSKKPEEIKHKNNIDDELYIADYPIIKGTDQKVLDFIRLTEAFVAAFKIIISKAIKRIEKIRRFI